VAANSVRPRRPRAIATFIAVHVSIWIAFGAALLAASSLWSSVDGAGVLAVVLALAAGWQLTGYKRRALRDCQRQPRRSDRGQDATEGVVRFALRHGLACVRSCWAMMLVMGVASSTMIFWMVAIAGIVITEKLARRPRHATHAAAALLAAGAVVAGAGVIV
jgi:predicted metal-binding membrane protein